MIGCHTKFNSKESSKRREEPKVDRLKMERFMGHQILEGFKRKEMT